MLADPGLGKSWLIRTETHRLCQQALARLREDAGAAADPGAGALRQLVAAAGQDLAEQAAGYLVTQGLLAERSRGRSGGMVRGELCCCWTHWMS